MKHQSLMIANPSFPTTKEKPGCRTFADAFLSANVGYHNRRMLGSLTSRAQFSFAHMHEIARQRTLRASRDSAAMRLAHRYRERVKLIEKLRMPLRNFIRERLACQRNQRFISPAIFARRRRHKLMPL